MLVSKNLLAEENIFPIKTLLMQIKIEKDITPIKAECKAKLFNIMLNTLQKEAAVKTCFRS